MNFRITITFVSALFFSACIAGPTPHPANDAGADPFHSGGMDASVGSPVDDWDALEATVPNADADSASDATAADDATGDVQESDGESEGDSVTSSDAPGDISNAADTEEEEEG